jgi:hypothetical protein
MTKKQRRKLLYMPTAIPGSANEANEIKSLVRDSLVPGDGDSTEMELYVFYKEYCVQTDQPITWFEPFRRLLHRAIRKLQGSIRKSCSVVRGDTRYRGYKKLDLCCCAPSPAIRTHAGAEAPTLRSRPSPS